MEIRRHSDARSFLARAEEWLLRAEVENGLILGVVRRLLGAHHFEEPIFLATLEDDGAVVGCAFRTPPYAVGLTSIPLGSIDSLVSEFADTYAALPGVNGPEAEASQFAEQWIAVRGGAWSIRFRIRLHVLTDVVPPENAPPGELRKATLADLDLVRAWADEFVSDTGVPQSGSEYGERPLRERALYLWHDDGPRSMVSVARRTPHGAGINAVYTPPAFRGRGYASSAVATVSQQRLDSGSEFCFLYTDLANPTSNSIYAQIGYEPVRDVVDLEFS